MHSIQLFSKAPPIFVMMNVIEENAFLKYLEGFEEKILKYPKNID